MQKQKKLAPTVLGENAQHNPALAKMIFYTCGKTLITQDKQHNLIN